MTRNLQGHHRTVELPPPQELLMSDSVQQPPPMHGLTNDNPSEGSQLLVLSAADETSLKHLAAAFDGFREHSRRIAATVTVSAVAYTLAAKRSLFDWRAFGVSDSASDIGDAKYQFSSPTKVKSSRKLAFIFSGQGAQYSRMGLELLTYDVFRESLEDAGKYFLALGSDWSLMGMSL